MVRLAETPRDLQRVFAIRHQVFVLEQGVPLDMEQDSYDAQAIHWLAWDGDQAVATARLVPTSNQQGKVGRVAVLQGQRGNGLGRSLMLAIHQWAEQENLKRLILDAQISVISFYDKLGYQAEGDIFEDCGILHRRMLKWLG